MNKILCILLIFLNCLSMYAQKYHFARAFRTDNSELADNMVYDMAEDQNGFLWIATENGLSRFDGKIFYNYSVKDGLPSNEILSVTTEHNGRLWVNCFRQPPAYFDEKTNRFVCERAPETDEKSTMLMQSYLPLQGGIVFFNHWVQLYYQQGKLQKIQKNFYPSIAGNYTYHEIIHGTEARLFVAKNGKLFPLDHQLHYFLAHQKIFGINYSRNNSVSELSAFSQKPPFYQEKKILIPELIKWKKFENDRLLIVTSTNVLKIIDLDTFRIIKEIAIPEEINNAFIDSKKNLWVSGKNSGLHLYTASPISTLRTNMSPASKNITCMTQNNGLFFIGNTSGQLLTIKPDGSGTKLQLSDDQARIRKILFFGNQPLLISDQGYAYKSRQFRKIFVHNTLFGSLKTAEKLNDSTAIIGGISGLVKLNINSLKTEKLNFPKERINSIAKINEKQLLISSAGGLFIYEVDDDRFKMIQQKYILCEAVAYRDLYFVSTISGEIEVFRNQRWIRTIKNSAQLPSAITRIKCFDNQLWIGGKDGLYKMDSCNTRKNLQYRISKFTRNDGLVSNTITDFIKKGDSIYVATDKGISVLAENIPTPFFTILPQIISLQINGKNARVEGHYQLKKEQNNISLLLAAVELSGHAERLQYRLNNDRKWITLNSNLLNLQLKGGITRLFIRAAGSNHNMGNRVKSILFEVEIPLYERFWFRFLVSSLLFGGVVVLYSYWKFTRQKEFYQHQLALETQRKKITADLHDDLGATLSSLQINSAVAGKMLEKDHDQARAILQKIENQARHISENMGDIIWSLKPGKDQFMSLSVRIRNFANEVLASQEIPFKIIIDKNLDTAMTDFTLRKNILLICKEALNNTAKYSKATAVTLSLVKNETDYVLEIADNGTGFDPAEIKGNGIQNIQKRTLEIGGIFEISSVNGTHIHISIPIIRE